MSAGVSPSCSDDMVAAWPKSIAPRGAIGGAPLQRPSLDGSPPPAVERPRAARAEQRQSEKATGHGDVLVKLE